MTPTPLLPVRVWSHPAVVAGLAVIGFDITMTLLDLALASGWWVFMLACALVVTATTTSLVRSRRRLRLSLEGAYRRDQARLDRWASLDPSEER